MIYEKLYINYKIEQDNTKLGFILQVFFFLVYNKHIDTDEIRT